MANLLFEDNFNGTNLDTSKWNVKNNWKPSNSPVCMLQENVSVSDGNLVTKSRNDGGGPCGIQRSSGYVDTKGKFSFKYGYAEMRAKLPKGKGIWPAFWMLPAGGGWPPEIDIFEMLGDKPNKLYFTVHASGCNDPNCGGYSCCKQGSYTGVDYSQDYHIFAIEWTPNYIAWIVDGVERFRSTQYTTQQAMFLVIDTYVGGDWPGNPDNTTQWPQYFYTDYVRVYDSKPTPGTKYRCTGSPDYQCVEDPSGPYNSLAECQTACQAPVTKYRCTGSPDYQCVEDPNGPYNSLAECQTACQAPVTKYRCTGSPDYQCVEDPNGPYNSLAECQAACQSAPTKYKCTGSPDYQCVEDPNGPYNSLTECQVACKPTPQTKKFKVQTIGLPTKPSGILVMKSTRGDYTADEACKLTCDTLKNMDK